MPASPMLKVIGWWLVIVVGAALIYNLLGAAGLLAHADDELWLVGDPPAHGRSSGQHDGNSTTKLPLMLRADVVDFERQLLVEREFFSQPSFRTSPHSAQIMANTSARFIAVAYNPADPTGCSDVKMSEGSALSNSKKEEPSTTSVDGSATGGSLRTPRALLLEHGGRCSLQDKVDRAREVGAEALFLLNVYGVVGSVEEEQVIGESDVVRHVDDTKQQSEGASTGNDELAPDTPSSSTPWRASILIVETDRPTSDWLWSRLPSNTTNGVGPRTTALVLELLLDDQLLLPSVLEAVMVVLVLVLSLALIVSMLMHLHMYRRRMLSLRDQLQGGGAAGNGGHMQMLAGATQVVVDKRSLHKIPVYSVGFENVAVEGDGEEQRRRVVLKSIDGVEMASSSASTSPSTSRTTTALSMTRDDSSSHDHETIAMTDMSAHTRTSSPDANGVFTEVDLASDDGPASASLSDDNHAAPLVDNCAICCEDFEEGAVVRQLFCAHIYHVPCIDRWITERSATCPLCKADVTVPADEDEQPLEWTPPDDENAPTATPSARYWSDWFPNRTITTTTPQDLTSVRVV